MKDKTSRTVEQAARRAADMATPTSWGYSGLEEHCGKRDRVPLEHLAKCSAQVASESSNDLLAKVADIAMHADPRSLSEAEWDDLSTVAMSRHDYLSLELLARLFHETNIIDIDIGF